MTEHGPTWREQSIAIANFLIENQSVDAFSVNKDGITDSVSGASISINDFISLVKECLTKAAPVATLEDTLDNTSDNTAESLDSNTKDTAENSGSTASEVTSTKDETKTVPGQIDAVSGATISSTAIVNGINQAQSFIKDFVMAK